MEISRWRKPPDPRQKEDAPRQGRWNTDASPIPPPPPGRIACERTIRWLAPPANFRRPFGTGHTFPDSRKFSQAALLESP